MSNRIRTIARRSTRGACLPALCLTVFLIAGSATAAAQHAAPITTQASADDGQSPAADKANRQSKRRVATVAVYLLAGIAFAGVALLGLVIVWGNRIRRIARTPLPRQSRTDELWYLRPKKEIETKQASKPPESDANGEETQTP